MPQVDVGVRAAADELRGAQRDAGDGRCSDVHGCPGGDGVCVFAFVCLCVQVSGCVCVRTILADGVFLGFW